MFQNAMECNTNPAFGSDGRTGFAGMECVRLGRQLESVRNHMLASGWQTLHEISEAIDAPETSCSARLRDLRKARYGSYKVERRHRGDAGPGLYEYRVMSPEEEY